LSIIQANLDTALEDKKISKEELNKLLKSSKKSIKFMNRLTEDLLLLSLLDQNIELESINIVSVIRDSIEEIKKLSGSEIKVNTVFAKDKIILEANRVLLERVTMNILENAFRYSDCNEIQVSVRNGRNNVQIAIKDNGKGIPKKDLRRIFDRFYRVDRSRSRESGGSGLGLSIVKKIIERFDGTILVDSAPGKGTQFTINLPTTEKS
jgi:two-component system phosphate regulon sensor histidine kinase PhoR